MSSEKRTGNRWRYRDFVVYRTNAGSGEGQLMNVSSGGLFVRTRHPPELGERIEIILQGTQPPVTLEAQVCWRGTRRDGAAGFGAELFEAPRAYLDLVRSLAAIGSVDAGPKRDSPRLEISIPVGIELENGADQGILCDISLSGARLEATALQPAEGSEVVVTFAVKGYRKAFEVLARVVRVTPDGGYAVEFVAIDSKLKHAFDYARSILRKLPDM